MSIDAETEIVDRGIITRTRSFPETKQYAGCVHYPTGAVCERSKRLSEGVIWKPIDEPLTSRQMRGVPFVDACAVYLGHLPSHFGHFLLETPARFWIFGQQKDWDYLIFNPFVTGDAANPQDKRVRSLLDTFGVDTNQVLILDRDTQFATVIVPSALLSPSLPVSPLLSDVYQRWRTHLLKDVDLDGPPRIYLSRRNFEQHRGESGVDEAQVELLFKEYAFSVIYPELLPFHEQVRLVAGAQMVAGLGGSALHLSVFMQPAALTLVIGTQRWPGPNRAQVVCNALSKSRVVFYPFSGQQITNPPFRFKIDSYDLRRFLVAQLEA